MENVLFIETNKNRGRIIMAFFHLFLSASKYLFISLSSYIPSSIYILYFFLLSFPISFSLPVSLRFSFTITDTPPISLIYSDALF